MTISQMPHRCVSNETRASERVATHDPRILDSLERFSRYIGYTPIQHLQYSSLVFFLLIYYSAIDIVNFNLFQLC